MEQTQRPAFADFEEAAWATIRRMQMIPELAHRRLAIIGSMAVQHVLGNSPDVNDVDLVIDGDLEPDAFRRAIVSLNTADDDRFVDLADFFFYKLDLNLKHWIKIDFMPGLAHVVLRETSTTVATVGANLPYLDATNLLALLIFSSGIRSLDDSNTRDAQNAASILDRITADGPIELDHQQRDGIRRGIQYVVSEIELPLEWWQERGLRDL